MLYNRIRPEDGDGRASHARARVRTANFANFRCLEMRFAKAQLGRKGDI